MEQLKNKKGFTLVECIVAMAVLAIMSLMLITILSIAVQQKTTNSVYEREIDEQVENIVKGEGDTETKKIESEIKFYANGIELSEKIPSGKDDGVTAENIKHKGDNVQMDSFNYDFDDYKKFEDIANGRLPSGDDGTTGTGYENSKCFGALDIKDGEVTIKESSRTEKIEKELKEDGEEKEPTYVEHKYYIITWRVSFETNAWANEKAVKIRIPKNGKLLEMKNIQGEATLDALSNTVFRIEPTANGYSLNEITFIISEDKIDSYKNVKNYFTGVGDSNTATVKIKY